MNEYMRLARELAEKGMTNKDGGPFGAVIVDEDGNIVSVGNNMVLKTNDPTAHAEIMAIRNAALKMKTHDLSKYILYTSCEPCPMCLSAIIWANIQKVYYGCTKEDADNIGFKDKKIYDYFNGSNKEIIDFKNIDRKECLKVFEKYFEENGEIY